MTKTILLTGATDGIGLELAHRLAAEGHHLLLHGRNPEKLQRVQTKLKAAPGAASIESFRADLSRLEEVERMAKEVAEKHPHLDVLINNAGVFETSTPRNEDGLDVRFLVNTLAPYMLTKQLLPNIQSSGRVINLSSAAQAPVDLEALRGNHPLDAFAAYAQSKLALTMWSRWLGLSLTEGPSFMSVNPGSMLGTKMVKEAFGVAGGDVGIGAAMLASARTSCFGRRSPRNSLIQRGTTSTTTVVVSAMRTPTRRTMRSVAASLGHSTNFWRRARRARPTRTCYTWRSWN